MRKARRKRRGSPLDHPTPSQTSFDAAVVCCCKNNTTTAPATTTTVLVKIHSVLCSDEKNDPADIDSDEDDWEEDARQLEFDKSESDDRSAEASMEGPEGSDSSLSEDFDDDGSERDEFEPPELM